MPNIRPVRMVKRMKGNPTWGRGGGKLPVIISGFDALVEKLHLSDSEFDHHPQVVAYVRKNYHRRYVPEWLLNELGLTPKVTISPGAEEI